jgi:hypothetical protein
MVVMFWYGEQLRNRRKTGASSRRYAEIKRGEEEEEQLRNIA